MSKKTFDFSKLHASPDFHASALLIAERLCAKIHPPAKTAPGAMARAYEIRRLYQAILTPLKDWLPSIPDLGPEPK